MAQSDCVANTWPVWTNRENLGGAFCEAQGRVRGKGLRFRPRVGGGAARLQCGTQMTADHTPGLLPETTGL
jgi:hypothetical protein